LGIFAQAVKLGPNMAPEMNCGGKDENGKCLSLLDICGKKMKERDIFWGTCKHDILKG
jgi:hypothetical protein